MFNKIPKLFSQTIIVTFLIMLLPVSAFCYSSNDLSNFKYIYENDEHRDNFHLFLKNVFNLYPDDEFHALIKAKTVQYQNDKDIYLQLEKAIPDIKPFLGDLRYSLPALKKQKKVMAAQSAQLLPSKTFNGYLELGSNGRYYDGLKDKLTIKGELYFVSPVSPTYGLGDIMDRGRITKPGDFFELDDYRIKFDEVIQPESLELVTVFIGFHHCPLDLKDQFMKSLFNVIKPGGYILVREHNVTDERSYRLAALAHDVFNVGTFESLKTNENELRHFTNIEEFQQLMQDYQFQPVGKALYQEGDPTLNGLMLFKKNG